MRVKSFAQEHSTMSWPGLEPTPHDLECTNHEVTAPPCARQFVSYTCRGFIKGQALGKLTGCKDDFACLV